MLSYRHSYHAGCHADVFKHIGLVLLLQALKRKSTPLLYLDTHAGRGMYSLTTQEAEKVSEYKEGILPLWECANPPEAALPYLALLRELNPKGKLTRYPGSPWFAEQLLSPRDDRIILNELHPRDFEKLSQHFDHHERTTVNRTDGLAQIKAHLPPIERRALVFVDPSYEIKTDYKNVPKAVWEGYTRFAIGVFCIWYPILSSGAEKVLLEAFKEWPEHKHCHVTFKPKRGVREGMYGSGLYIINPPFEVEEQLLKVSSHLMKVLK